MFIRLRPSSYVQAYDAYAKYANPKTVVAIV